MVRVYTQPLVLSELTQATVPVPQLSEAVTFGLQPGTLPGLQPRLVLVFEQLSNVGGVVSTTLTMFEHVLLRLLLSVIVTVTVKLLPQALQAVTSMELLEDEPLPQPLTDQLYETMFAGAV